MRFYSFPKIIFKTLLFNFVMIVDILDAPTPCMRNKNKRTFSSNLKIYQK
jgi:hypothetical protein